MGLLGEREHAVWFLRGGLTETPAKLHSLWNVTVEQQSRPFCVLKSQHHSNPRTVDVEDSIQLTLYNTDHSSQRAIAEGRGFKLSFEEFVVLCEEGV